MKSTYLKLECKRALINLPRIILGITAFITATILIALFSYKAYSNNKKDMDAFRVALVQNTEDAYTALGISIITDLDVLQKTFAFERMDEDTARFLLKNEEIDAIFIFPDDYATAILYGEDTSVEVVQREGNPTLSAYLSKNLSSIASDYILESEKSIFAQKEYYDLKNLDGKYDDETALNKKFFRILLNRTNIYTEKELSNTKQVSQFLYFSASGIILFLAFSLLTYVKIFAGDDYSFYKRIKGSGINASHQILSRFATITLVSTILNTFIITIFYVLKSILKLNIPQQMSLKALLLCLPLVLPFIAISLLIYELSTDTSGGLLIYFILITILGFTSGLFYPNSFLPSSFKTATNYLITNIERNYILRTFDYEIAFKELLIILLHTFIFIALTIIVRNKKLKQ